MTEHNKGTSENAVDAVQNAAGQLVEEAPGQLKGKAQQVAGQVQETYGDMVEHVSNLIANTPIKAIAIAGAIGFAVGALRSRGRYRR